MSSVSAARLPRNTTASGCARRCSAWHGIRPPFERMSRHLFDCEADCLYHDVCSVRYTISSKDCGRTWLFRFHIASWLLSTYPRGYAYFTDESLSFEVLPPSTTHPFDIFLSNPTGDSRHSAVAVKATATKMVYADHQSCWKAIHWSTAESLNG